MPEGGRGVERPFGGRTPVCGSAVRETLNRAALPRGRACYRSATWRRSGLTARWRPGWRLGSDQPTDMCRCDAPPLANSAARPCAQSLTQLTQQWPSFLQPVTFHVQNRAGLQLPLSRVPCRPLVPKASPGCSRPVARSGTRRGRWPSSAGAGPRRIEQKVLLGIAEYYTGITSARVVEFFFVERSTDACCCGAVSPRRVRPSS